MFRISLFHLVVNYYDDLLHILIHAFVNQRECFFLIITVGSTDNFKITFYLT